MRVVVIGAGIIGAACARTLARAGANVLVVDRGSAAGGTSAACEGNILVSDKTPGAELDLALLGSRRWAEVAEELADELADTVPSIEFERKGGVVVSSTGEGARALRRFCARQRTAGVVVEDLDPIAMYELEPDLSPDVVAGAYYPQDAQVQPTTAVEALLASARRAGARVRTHELVVGPLLAPDGAIRGVRTRLAAHEADVVVNAAGPWSGAVAEKLGVHLPVLPRRGMVLVTTRMPHRVFHKVYDADYVGATQSDDAGLQTSTVVESTASGTVLIGSSRERVGFDETVDPSVAAAIAVKAIGVFPFLAQAQLLRAYVGFRPYLPDHLPLVGPDARLPGLFHVTGHEGAGIGLSVPSADLLAAQVLGLPLPFDASPFLLDRPSLAAHLQSVA
ncbi:FAD-dependent oxidoreductase [Nocardioides sp. InS609-2]|uniref:NAD(P)/FAD-dependent oxidoreductase n=1 Tax=Nocardioides sp. InS609-2 TaxID=2760705 RepID=UPI0020C0CD97|nr:FAD-dependent oxidoreductase [Nocardioides sp. InS609-2]